LSTTFSVRRPFAALTAIALLAGGLALAPSAAPTAEAVTASKVGASALSQINSYRKAAKLKSLATNTDLTLYVQQVADYYAANGSLDGADFDDFEFVPPTPIGDGAEFVFRIKGTDKSKAPAAVAKKIKSLSNLSNKTGIYGAFNYGTVGTATKSGYTYVAAIAVKYDLKLQKTAKPTISGKLAVGSTLTARAKGWGPTGTKFDVVWYVGNESFAGGSRITVTPDLVGKRISIRVYGTKSGYADSERRSAKTAAIALGSLSGKTPVVTGSRVVGSTLTVAAADWGPDDITWSYSWYRNGTKIAGEAGSAYTQTAKDAGKRIDVKVAAKATGYKSGSKTTATKTKTAGVFTTVTPTISGSAVVGSTLSVSAGTWTPKPTSVTYKWFRDGVVIAKATAKSYKVVEADNGHAITVRVYGAREGYKTGGATSAPRVIGAP